MRRIIARMSGESSSTATVETRRLATIMFTDMVGFSRQMGADEARMLRLLDVHNRIIQQAAADHHGHVIKTIGDAFLVDFPSVVHAVQCAQHIQAQFRTHNAEKEPTEQIHVRIGIDLGDIVQRDGDVFGDGVNVASRLQALAAPDTICLSHVVYREVEKKLALGTVISLGRPKLKNIAQREPVYALLLEQPKGLQQLAGHYEKAIVSLKKVVSFNQNYLPARVSLAICYAELGQEEEARAEAAEILRLMPTFSLEDAKQRWPFKDSAVLERDLAALRKAGLK